MQSLCSARVTRWALAVLLPVTTLGCAMDKTTAPPLAGPSEFGLSIDLSATPDVINRDGLSQSAVNVIARDPSGKGIVGQRFRLSLAPTNGGTLSDVEVQTGADGRGTVVYTSAAQTLPIQRVTVGATPIGGNFDNARTQTVTISLRGAAAPVPVFTFSPAAPKQFDLVTFVATGTTLDGSACQSRCTFSWTFGAEGSATGEVVSHRFGGQGTHVVTLTVTGPDNVVATSRQTIVVTEAAPPEAKFVFSPSNPRPGEEVRFIGTTSIGKGGARVVDWNWNFGNGETGSGEVASTTFDAARTYVVVLTVKDNNGLTHSVTQNVSVTEPTP